MPLTFGYVAASEQFHPRELVELAAHAQTRGFSGVMVADHFQPWLPRHGHSAFVWGLLSALGERTAGDLGPGVSAPTFRYHPAIVAQAAATLEAMYPGRSWLGLGSGEAINEHVVAQYWPEAPERIGRLFEAVDLIKRLFAGSLAGRDTRFAGQYFRLEATRLWTMPDAAPPVLVAASGPVTAKRAGRVADGLITQDAPLERMAHLLARFADGAREAGKDPARMPKLLQVRLSWARTDEEAWAGALEEWPLGAIGLARSDLRSPVDVAQLAASVRREDFGDRMVVSADPDVHRAALQRYVDLGFDRIYLRNVGRNQREWIDVCGREVLPRIVR
ncbi:MAG: TIGR03557 family F420-dependent LLM class oxidoreductase [Bifidobacteriaceae bacterium]|jgi:G6PDH family F420-dependent oxidoreductase|nr:TIGR03557 family F420-dependent LLM class oxidoreductase [Bifidobacteriaceae bacterium]